MYQSRQFKTLYVGLTRLWVVDNSMLYLISALLLPRVNYTQIDFFETESSTLQYIGRIQINLSGAHLLYRESQDPDKGASSIPQKQRSI